MLGVSTGDPQPPARDIPWLARHATLLLVLALLVALAPSAYLAWSQRDMPHFGFFGDDSIYWMSAKSLAGGTGYRILSFPEQPYQTKYPPLYPLLLSAVWRIFPEFPANLTPAVLISWLLLPVYLAAVCLMYRELSLGPNHALILCCVIALNPYVALFSASLMTELMFGALLLASLALAERGSRSGEWAGLTVAAGLVAGAAYLTRSVGIVLLISGPLCFVFRRQFRRAGLFLAAMAPAVAGWTLWKHLHGSASTDSASLFHTSYTGFYLDTILNSSASELALMVTRNIDTILSSAGGLLLLPPGDSRLAYRAWQLLGIAAIAGAVWLARRRLTQYHLFAAGCLGILVVWNGITIERYLFPVLPLMLAGLAGLLLEGFKRTLAWSRSPVWRREMAGVAGLAGITVLSLAALLLVFAGATAMRSRMFEDRRQQLAAIRAAYRWIDANLPADAKFVAYDPAMLYLFTGRRGVRVIIPPLLTYMDDRKPIYRILRAVDRFAADNQARYLLVTADDMGRELWRWERPIALKLLLENPALRLLYSSSRASVFQAGAAGHPESVSSVLR